MDLNKEQQGAEKWQKFITSIKVSLTTSTKTIVLPEKENLADTGSLLKAPIANTPQIYPLIQVKLLFEGKGPYTLVWDDNFARVLWQGDFVLSAQVKDKKETSLQLKFQTSNTYEPMKKIELIRGDALHAVLDFHKLPGSYLTHLFQNKGHANVKLFIKKKDRQNTLQSVSNELEIDIK